MSTPRLAAVRAFAEALRTQGAPQTWVGVDGFVDEIVQVVDQRHGPRAEDFTPVRSMADYARRLAAAAGKSTNVELVTREIKMGGNAALMAAAMGRLGARIELVAAIGDGRVEEPFQELAAFGTLIPIARPGQTIAAEFADDSKIMHGRMEGIRDITFDRIVHACGGLAAFDATLSRSRLIALLNWTMVPHHTDILRQMDARLVALGHAIPPFAFFDLCDPVKRSREDLREALMVMGTFSCDCMTAILGLNEGESEAVASALDLPLEPDSPEALLRRAEAIAKITGITEVVIHPTAYAVSWGRAGFGVVEGPWSPKPRVLTGAGDHFNGGYTLARVLGVSPAESLSIGTAVSGFYVRRGRGPTVEELADFVADWESNRLAIADQT